ncbi:6-phosphofructokinase [Spirochaetota bacterium]|nr:6-phosphofructokinase [Spirochaetota bacterium]
MANHHLSKPDHQNHTSSNKEHLDDKKTPKIVRSPNTNNFSITTLGEPNLTSPLYEKQNFISEKERVLVSIRSDGSKSAINAANIHHYAFEKSGPRYKIFFNPQTIKVGIITCGGLCPGLNSIIYGLVRQLWNRYEVKNIVGIYFGYQGLSTQASKMINLSPENVRDIHFLGGTILGTSRGTPPAEEIVTNLAKHQFNILFAIGGDGTMRGAHLITEEIAKRNLKISVIGIPKTIDNDIPYVITSFGFETAVEKASDTIMAAHEEARGHRNGIGLVKVMGRYSGYLAAHATMSTGVVSLCLIPEIPFTLTGKRGLIPYIHQYLKQKSYMVIVVAEGAGQDLIKTPTIKYDASGNKVLPDIGTFLKNEINAAFKGKNFPISLKYLDPSYYVRSARPNCFDRVFCSRIAQNAVHAAMAGKTAMLIGYWHGEMTHVPFKSLYQRTKRINPNGTLWFNVIESTVQGDINTEEYPLKH